MKPTLTRFTLMLLMLVLASFAAQAGEDFGDHPILTLSPYAGTTLLSDEIGLEDDLIFGGRVGFWFSPYLGIEGTYGYSDTETTIGADATELHHTGVDLVMNLMPNRMLNPYILGGWGQFNLKYDGAPNDEDRLNGWEAGAGLKIRLGGDDVNRRDLRLEVRNVMSDLAAGWPNDGDMTHNLIATAGFQFGFGRGSIDSDGDGVKDGKDACLDTPLGALVNKEGCPSDEDSDGVYDGLDRCEGTPAGATVDIYGCPVDSDGDGVFDGIDRCLATPAGAVVDFKGCPVDSDGDGVFDGLDKCADTPAGMAVTADGCPADSDGDGVSDDRDQCPGTPANLQVNAEGCPIQITEAEVELFDTGMIRTSTVNFASGSAELTEDSLEELNSIGETLSNWPELIIEVGGHTDSQGSETDNQALSHKRAQAVLDYMAARFPKLPAAKYTAVGYGETAPIADNGTPEGRAHNRRVEFKILNAEEAKRVIENQKLLER
jgi:OOP family OmpA-OmpF porin